MARTKHHGKPAEPTIVKSLNYNGAQIHRMDDGSIMVEFAKGGTVPATSRGDAMKIINDTLEAEKAFEAATPTKGRRTKGVHTQRETASNVIEFPRGGHTPNPVSWCKHKVTFNNGKTFWAENVCCAYQCKENVECPTFRDFMAGRKLRIQRLDYKTMPPNCPFCQCEVAVKGDDVLEYVCKTTADKKTGTYDRKCGLKKSTRTKK